MFYGIAIVLHILISLLLIAVVLMQSGRGGGGLAGAFGGGGGNQTLFGGRGASGFLTKATWVLGASFMVISLLLALAVSRRGGPVVERSILQENPIEAPQNVPLAPPGTPGTGEPGGDLPPAEPSETGTGTGTGTPAPGESPEGEGN
ncbi:MAG: preprotein translocase subunit SecG [Candidatus Eisenbacteria bacterium]|nr:preprotein translocase subunit SecG [Candidatus Latescibacterota bacterium]MBD3301401.1 preprotein translocase subunit SecG [Candidatus Eisenbacteria bacterium]